MLATFALPRPDWRLLERQARQRLDEWRALLGGQTGQARTVLRELLEDRAIVFTPHEAEPRGYTFDGNLGVRGLVAGIVPASHGNCASPRGPGRFYTLRGVSARAA